MISIARAVPQLLQQFFRRMARIFVAFASPMFPLLLLALCSMVEVLHRCQGACWERIWAVATICLGLH